MSNILEEIQREYDKFHCPVCGCTPRVIPTGRHSYQTSYCGHPQLEAMIEEFENHFPIQEEKKLINPFKKE